MDSELFNHLFKIGDRFSDENGATLLLHKVGASTLQLTDIESGDTYYQFLSKDGETLCINRDVSSDEHARQLIMSLSPILKTQKQTDLEEKLKQIALEEKTKHEKELESVTNEIRIFIRDFSGTMMFNVKDALVNGESVDQSEIVKDFSSLISTLMNTFADVYNNIKDRKLFFQLVLSGFEFIQNRIYEIFENSEYLNPDITAKFFFGDGGDVELIISDEKEDVLRYRGSLQQNDTILTTRAIKYIIIPNIKDIVGMRD
jgi:hypothetical protein